MTSVGSSAGTSTAPAANGRAMGGQSPISGGTVKLWAVNTSGGTATNLLTSTVTTNSAGYFTITGLYSCPTASTQVYLTVMGGNPGLSGNNPALALMAALGSCGSLSSSTFVVVNEVTTVASVWALQQFIGANFGVAGAVDVAVNTMSQSVAGMQNAFATVPVLVTLSQGATVSNYSNATIPVAKLNTIANILSSCVNSDGTGLCSQLFAAVTPSSATTPADTIQAALYMALNPNNNIPQIYAFQTAVGAPFSPSMSTAPLDLSLGVIYSIASSVSIPAFPYLLTADASGNLWIGDAGGNTANALLELGPNGQSASGSPFLTGSTTPISSPQTIAVDTVGNVWVVNHGSSKNSLVSFPGSGSTFTTYTAPSSPTACLPETMAIDGSNNIWYACSGITNLFELPNIGTVNTPAYSSSATQFGAVGTTPYGMAVDTTGNIWVANDGVSTVTEFPAGSTPSTTPTTYTLGSGTMGIAADHSGNIWAAASSALYELVKSGSTYSVSGFSGGGLNSARYLAIDGGGNIWIANSGTTTYAGSTYVSLSEFNNNGTAITPAAQTLVPGGYAIALPSTFGTPYVRGITIDPSGNVWAAGCGLSTSCNAGANAFVMEIVGAATPVVTPLASAIANNYLGCCSFTPAAPGGSVPTAPGYISLQASSYSPMQLGNSLAFLVTRTGGSTGTVGVSYATSNGTATGGNNTCTGVDYTTTSGTLSWSSGDTSVRTITVPWCAVANFTGSKSFTLTLSSVTGGATITPYASTLVSVSNQVTSTVINSGTYPFFTGLTPPFSLTPPSNYFNMSMFRHLTLPTDIYGGIGGVNSIQFAAATVSSLTGYSSPYFYINSSNQIVFSAPSNGAVTSPGVGSDDTRSEFGENYTGPGYVLNGDWYGDANGGTGGVMTGTCAVMVVSPDTDVDTFAQIHGANNPFILMVYRPAFNDVAVQINTTSANLADTRTEMAANVALGDTISYSLSYSAPSLTDPGTATVQVTDVTTNTVNAPQTFTIDSSWSGQPMYFTLGAYGGPNHLGNPASDYKQVVYTNWKICHSTTCTTGH